MSDQAQALLQQGLALHQQGQLQEAQEVYRAALAAVPSTFDALHLLGVVALQQGDHLRAVDLISQAIALYPGNALFHYNRACAEHELGRSDEAYTGFSLAISLQADYAQAYCNRGNVLQQQGQFTAAVADYEKAIEIMPRYTGAYFNRGNALLALSQWDAAVASYEQALAIEPAHAQAHNNRGNALQACMRWEEAVRSYDQAIAAKPDHAQALYNRGNALCQIMRWDAALASYDAALALVPEWADAFARRAVALMGLRRLQEALASYGEALRIDPNNAGTLYSRGNLLRDLKRFEAAIADYDRAAQLQPDLDYLQGVRAHAKMHLCDWRDHEADMTLLADAIARDRRASTPLPLLALFDSPALHRQATQTYAQHLFAPGDALGPLAAYAPHERIRLGYFSADFREHPVSLLTAQLYELHDRARFEVIAFSFGPDTGDAMRQRLTQAFDQFIDVRSFTDEAIASLARKMEIDIAVDLGGFTRDSRTGIFALRAAPVQVSYIGYLGTMAVPYMDYLIADKTIVPAELAHHYAEKIVWLPSYQVNDATRLRPDPLFTRDALGLPPTGFVFACFNNNFKITPEVYACWMRILKQVPGSVLLLYGDTDGAQENLKAQAVRSGVDGNRVLFGQRLALPQYLARYRAVDLFLDTFPYNAGTTASDSLWMGVPLLTLPGQSFASRVAASLLHAVELPELIASSRAQYESMAVDLATHPEKLQVIRSRLQANRARCRLFDTPRFAASMEAAYVQMYERNRVGLAPDHLDVNLAPSSR